jgi:hypothetical protein
MNTKNLLTTFALGLVVVACSQIPKEAYFSRGQPESLIEKSSKVVTLQIASPASIEEITGWINRDQPTRAELKCFDGDSLCNEVHSVLHQFGVPTTYSETQNNSVALIYEKVQAHDCETRYIDNVINPYNLNHPTFGCTVSLNMVQMVTDKREFTDPQRMDYANAGKTSQTVGFYNTPESFSPAKVDSEFPPIVTPASIAASGSGGGGGGGGSR